MKNIIFVIGANSTLAKAVIPVLARRSTIITGGRKDCDIYCDITKEVTVPTPVDVVINFAANFGGTSAQEITRAVDTNVLGTLRVCEAAKMAHAKQVILISSIFALLDERAPSYSSYAISKKQADELANFYCKLHNIPLAILRPSRLYGDNESFAKNQPFLYQIIDKAEKGENISIYGRNDASRNYLHVADLAEIIDRTIKLHVEGVYGCVNPVDVTYSQIARIAQKMFNAGGQVISLNDKPDIPNDTFEKNPDIYNKLNYYPAITIKQGLQRIKKFREKSLT